MTVIPSTHNIRRPAFWLLLTCIASAVFLLLTDPRAGLVPYHGQNIIDAANNAHVGTVVGLAGCGAIGLIALFLCTRKGSPPTK